MGRSFINLILRMKRENLMFLLGLVEHCLTVTHTIKNSIDGDLAQLAINQIIIEEKQDSMTKTVSLLCLTEKQLEAYLFLMILVTFNFPQLRCIFEWIIESVAD